MVTETAKNTKKIVTVSKHQVTYLFSLFKKTQQKKLHKMYKYDMLIKYGQSKRFF